MSYHILHVSDYGCRLFKERGLLVCERGGSIIGKIALEDLRAVILLNEAVSISGAVISDLSGRDAVIIHCKNFKLCRDVTSKNSVFSHMGILSPHCCGRDGNASK